MITSLKSKCKRNNPKLITHQSIIVWYLKGVLLLKRNKIADGCKVLLRLHRNLTYLDGFSSFWSANEHLCHNVLLLSGRKSDIFNNDTRFF